MKKFKEVLLNEIGEVAYKNYFANSSLRICDDSLQFSAPNVFVQRFVMTKYKTLLEQLCEQLYGKKLNLQTPQKAPSTAMVVNNPATQRKNSTLNAALRFDNFIVGESNNYAFSVCKQVCDMNKFGKLFNPIFIYSTTGLGKTHLLNACGQECQQLGKNVIFKTSKTFKNDYQAAQKSNNWQQFNEQFAGCELLLIDDVQFLANTESMQEEFFHIFNDVAARGGQIIITSDVAPKDLHGIQDRLKSRFANGIITNITPPDLETKQAILSKKCELYDISLDKKIIDLIANYLGKNIRDIEGMITAINSWQMYTSKAITLEDAKKLISEYVSEKAQVIEIDDILQIVSDEMSVKISELQSATKTRKVVLARRVVIFLAKELLQNAVGQIAQSLKMKAHSNVSHHLKIINNLLITDIEFFNLCESIKSKLLNKN